MISSPNASTACRAACASCSHFLDLPKTVLLTNRLFLIASLLLLGSLSIRGQVPLCDRALSQTSPSISPESRWQNDTVYHVTSVDDPTSHERTVLITGNSLNITESSFKSLASAANSPLKGIAKLVFDANAIVLDMPLYLDSTQVSFHAHSLQFTSRGQIYFPPDRIPRLNGDGVEIVADELDLSSSKAVPFNFQTDNWAYIEDRANERPWPANQRRTIRIICGTVVHQDFLASTDKAIFEFFRARTQDKEFGHAPDGSSSRPYVLRIGSAASAPIADMHQTATWPKERAWSVIRFFARAPYDQDSLRFLQGIISESLAAIPPQQSLALSSLRRVQDAISHGTDLFARSKYYVPRMSLETELTSFKEALPTRLALAAKWAPSVVKAFESSGVDEVSIERRRQSLSELKERYRETERTLELAKNHLSELEQRVTEANKALDNKTQLLEQRQAELKARDEEAAKKRQNIRTFASVLSLVPASAPVGIAIAVGGVVGSELALNPEYSQGVTIDNLSDLIKTGTEFNARVTKFRNSWDGLRGSYKKLDESKSDSDRKDARKALGDSADEFQNRTREMFDATKDPKPTELKLKDYQNEPEVIALLQQLADLRNQQKPILDDIKTLEGQATSSIARIAEQQAYFEELLIPTVVNDQAIAARQVLAMAVLDDIFTELASDANLLRRAYVYATGEDVQAPQTIATVADTDAGRSLGLFDASVTTDASKRGQEAAKLLESARADAEQNYGALVEAVNSGYKRYCEKINCAGRPVSIAVRSFSDRSAIGHSVVGRLNDVIRRGSDSSNASEAAIEVPIPTSWDDIDYRLNRRIVYAEITDVSLKNPEILGDGSLELQVFNDGYGMIRKMGCAFPVDFRPGQPLFALGAPLEFISSTTILRNKSLQLKDKPQWIMSNGPFKYVYYPPDSRFVLRVVYHVSGRPPNGGAVPEVSEFRVMFYVYP